MEIKRKLGDLVYAVIREDDTQLTIAYGAIIEIHHEVRADFDTFMHELIEYEDLIFKDEWLNKTYSITTIDDELGMIRNRIDGDLLVIENLCDSTIEKIELINDYKTCLDISSVINNYNNRKNLIRKAIENDDDNEYTITLEIKTTKSKMEVIKDLLEKLEVEYRRVK
jgi:hypothetical protein